MLKLPPLPRKMVLLVVAAQAVDPVAVLAVLVDQR